MVQYHDYAVIMALGKRRAVMTKHKKLSYKQLNIKLPHIQLFLKVTFWLILLPISTPITLAKSVYKDGTDNNTANSRINNNDAVAIVASIKPIQLLVDEIRRNTTATQTPVLLKANQDHHLHSLKPSQRRLIAKAELVFYISDEFEAYMHRIRLSGSDKHKKFIALGTLPYLRILEKRQSGDMPHSYHPNINTGLNAKDSHKHHANEHSQKHSQEHQSPPHDEHRSTIDWHLWLNPDNAIMMLDKIREELTLLAPSQRDRFQLNFELAKHRITQNAAETTESLMTFMRTPFISLHDGYQYFEDQYGVYSSGTIYEGDSHKPPSIKHISEIKQLVSQKNIRCAWREYQYPDKTLNTVFGDSRYRTAIIDSLGQNPKTPPNSYIELINNITSEVKQCLSKAR